MSDIDKFKEVLKDTGIVFGLDNNENDSCIEVELNNKSIAIVFDEEGNYKYTHKY